MRRFRYVVTGLFVVLLVADAASAAPPLDPGRVRARLDARGAARRPLPARAPEVDRAESPRRTTSVTYGAVVILLQFPDWPADTLSHPPSAYDSLLLSVGAHPTGSMRDYYREVSRGQFDLDGVVTRWYMAPRPYTDYVNGQGGFGSVPFNAQSMAADAVLLADADIDFTQFDNDGPDGIPTSGDDDGVVDAIFVVHAGPGGEESGATTDMWSHKWNLPAAFKTEGGTGPFAFTYTTEPEEWLGVSQLAPPGSLISIGVFCHEFGHVLGLPDLYDTRVIADPSEGIGEWCLMGSGLYTHRPGNPPGSSPAHMGAWAKARLHWVEPIWVTQDSLGVTIPPVETTGTVFRLWTNGIEDVEHFLVENRQPIGFDRGLVRSTINGGGIAAHGLMIYHVDAGIVGNDDPAHKMVDVEEAGGAESGGSLGVQNLDINLGTSADQLVCGSTIPVTGNRGDGNDPWPGLLGATSFEPNTCPGTESYCGGAVSQVSIKNIAEAAGLITADFLVRGISVLRTGVALADDPGVNPANNGDGRAEPGETVELRIPLQNLAATVTGPLVTRVTLQDPAITLHSDSMIYSSISGGGVDSGSAVLADIHPTTDPRGVVFRYGIYSPSSLVDSDSVQVLVGSKLGLCDFFENTDRSWFGVPSGCNGINEWHRESGVNHTPGGAWAWRLGPTGLLGAYAASQDARLVSQPIRISGASDTLYFWHRFDCELFSDGLTVEASENGGATWTMLVPVGGYPTGDRWSGVQSTFRQERVPLTDLSGLVQIAFRFRSQPPNQGLGWWIDDVRVTGDSDCATTSIAISRFGASVNEERTAIALVWTVTSGSGAALEIDRATTGSPRGRLTTLPYEEGTGGYEDRDILPGTTYTYWLTAVRPGETSAESGPVSVEVPVGPTSPRTLAIESIQPNPFSARAAIRISLDRDGPVVLRVYRVDGALVRTIQNASLARGLHALQWDGDDDRGAPAGGGIYFIHLTSQGRTRVQKGILIR